MTYELEVPERHGIWRKGIWYPMSDLIKSSAELGDPKITDIVHNGKPSSDTPVEANVMINGTSVPFYIWRTDYPNMGPASGNKWTVSPAP